jgi:hypothetical protein
MRPVFDRLIELGIPQGANTDEAPDYDRTLIQELEELIHLESLAERDTAQQFQAEDASLFQA